MRKHNPGFIEPLTLLTLGFLVASLIITTALVTNPEIKQDIRQFAAVYLDEPCKECRNQKCVPTNIPRCSPTLNECSRDSQCQKTPAAPTGQATDQPKPKPAPTQPNQQCQKFGKCVPKDYTCERSYGQLDCPKGQKCGSHCSKPVSSLPASPTPAPETPIPPPPTSNLPCIDPCQKDSDCGDPKKFYCYKPATGCPECRVKPSPVSSCATAGSSGLCVQLNCCSGLTKISGMYGYCQCSSTKACTPGSTRCDANYQETCKADGSGWNRKICEFSCENNNCKAAPAGGQPLARANGTSCTENSHCLSNYCHFNEDTKKSVCATGQKRCNATNTAVEEYQKGQWVKTEQCLGYCDSQTASCQGGTPSYAPENVLPPELAAVNPPEDPLGLTQDPITAANLNQERKWCIEKYGQKACDSAYQEALTTKDPCIAREKLQNPSRNINEIQEQCNLEHYTMGLLGLSMIPVIGPAMNAIVNSLAVLECAGTLNPAVCALAAVSVATSGSPPAAAAVQPTAATSPVTGSWWDPFGDTSNFRLTNAPDMQGPSLGTAINETYQALTGTAFADDALLSVVNNQYVSGRGTQRVIINLIEDPYLAQYLDEAQLYINSQRTSQRVSRVPLAQQFVTQTFPGYSGADIPRSVIEETMATQQSIYRERGGTAYLGEFINCQAGVCREQSLTLHAVLARAGKESEVVTGYLGAGGKHAWVEYIDSVTGIRMVADSVWDFVLPAGEAYKLYGGISNITKQVFVTP